MKKRLIKNSMTLVELLVVLTIMAAVATVALTGANEMMEQAKTDESVRRGNLIADTVNGNGSSASRFIADMGRLPKVISWDEDDEIVPSGKILSELWDSDIVDSDVKWGKATHTPDWSSLPILLQSKLPATVELYCGWRGPYLNISKDEFYDGYGNEWKVNTNSSGETWENNLAVSRDDTIYGVQSLGRDGNSEGTEWYDENREFEFAKEGSCSCDLNVTVKYLDTDATPSEYTPFPGSGTIIDKAWVALFVPEITRTSKSVKRILAEWDTASKQWELNSELQGSPLLFSGLFPGPRYLYACGYKVGSESSVAYESGLIHLDLKPGSNSIMVYLSRDLNN